MIRLLIPILLLTLTSHAHALQLGIGDQNPQMFADTRFKELNLRLARINVSYNVAEQAGWERDRLDWWLHQAKEQGISPLITFHHLAGNHSYLPKPHEYQRAVRAFRLRYPWVREYTVWNEANHHTQPTAKKPKVAAKFFNILSANCKGCKIVAADLLDQKNLVKWLRDFKKVAKQPKLWGLHNYVDAHNFKTPVKRSNTAKFLKLVKGEVWLTETGGIVAFTTEKGKVAKPYNEKRAAKATKRTFELAKLSKRIKRLYLYNWLAPASGTNRWDSGLVGPDGKERPALKVVKEEHKKLKK